MIDSVAALVPKAEIEGKMDIAKNKDIELITDVKA